MNEHPVTCGFKGDPVCEPPNCSGACPTDKPDLRPVRHAPERWIVVAQGESPVIHAMCVCGDDDCSWVAQVPSRYVVHTPTTRCDDCGKVAAVQRVFPAGAFFQDVLKVCAPCEARYESCNLLLDAEAVREYLAGEAAYDAASVDCLNGCHDLDYGDDEGKRTVCTCTPAETMAAVERLNDRGISVVFVPGS